MHQTTLQPKTTPDRKRVRCVCPSDGAAQTNACARDDQRVFLIDELPDHASETGGECFCVFVPVRSAEPRADR